MDKLDMQSKNLVDENISKIAQLFPNCITEGKNEEDFIDYQFSDINKALGAILE